MKLSILIAAGAVAAVGLAGCSSTSPTKATPKPAASQSAAQAAPASHPFATLKPRDSMGDPTCATVTYTITPQGVLVRVVTTQAAGVVGFEASDASGNPVDQNSDVFTTIGAGVHTVLLKGVRSLAYVAVTDTGDPADSCSAFKA